MLVFLLQRGCNLGILFSWSISFTQLSDSLLWAMPWWLPVHPAALSLAQGSQAEIRGDKGKSILILSWQTDRQTDGCRTNTTRSCCRHMGCCSAGDGRVRVTSSDVSGPQSHEGRN